MISYAVIWPQHVSVTHTYKLLFFTIMLDAKFDRYMLFCKSCIWYASISGLGKYQRLLSKAFIVWTSVYPVLKLLNLVQKTSAIDECIQIFANKCLCQILNTWWPNRIRNVYLLNATNQILKANWRYCSAIASVKPVRRRKLIVRGCKHQTTTKLRQPNISQ